MKCIDCADCKNGFCREKSKPISPQTEGMECFKPKIPQSKRCRKCGRELPLSEFRPDKRNKDGFSSVCKVCEGKVELEKPLPPQKLNLTSLTLKSATTEQIVEELKRRGYAKVTLLA